MTNNPSDPSTNRFEFTEIGEDAPEPDLRRSIDVAERTIERLEALYRAGHLPDSAGLQEMADALGWDDCVELDRVIAWNLFVEVRLPDGRCFAGHEIAEHIGFEHPCTSRVGDIVIAPRQGVFSWWAGSRGDQ